MRSTKGRHLAEAARIVLFSVLAAIVYGVVHDLVTAHICVEYFTIAHPPLFPTRSPILLALGWGVVATWWVGLLLGLGLAAAARLGNRTRLNLADLRRPIVQLMLACGAIALGAGLLGAVLAEAGAVWLTGDLRELIPRERHSAFLFALWAHSASYLAGALGGFFVIVRTARIRAKSESERQE
jgi:hypothetical protein